MLFTLILLFVIASTISASESNTKPVKFQFKDGETVDTTLSHISWSKTLHNAALEFDTSDPIPVDNAHRNNFYHLTTLIQDDKTQKAIASKKNTAYELEQLFFTTAVQHQLNTSLGHPTFLSEANFLDLGKNCISALAAFYARKMDNPTIRADGSTIIFDALPLELYRFIAGWLVHDTLKKMNPVKEIQKIKVEPVLASQHIVSTSAADGTFVCIWEEEVFGRMPISKRRILCTVNPTKKSASNYVIPSIEGILSKNNCVLSHDGSYLLFITETPKVHTIQLYDLRSLETNKLNQPIGNKNVYYRIIATLFNSHTQRFNIVATEFKGWFEAASNETDFHFLTINPDNDLGYQYWKTHKDPASYINKPLDWSCIHSHLVGTSPQVPSLIYTDDQLCECQVDEEDPCVFHYVNDSKRNRISFDYLTPKADHCCATEIAFIPGFNNIRNALYATVGNAADSRATSSFDVHHLCVNEVRDHVAITHHMIDPKLRKILQLCSTKLYTGDDNILPEAYAAFCYFNRRDTWKEKCALILDYRPEIGQILEEDNPQNSNASQKCIVS
jgi:hypothetical protein